MKKPKKVALSDLRVVVQHNNLVNAHYEMSTIELKIFLIMLATIKKEDEELEECLVPVSSFYETPNGSAYQHIKRSGEALTKRNITVEDIHQKEFISFPLMSYCRYKQGEGHIHVKFNQSIKPYLLKLQGRFTMCDFGTLFSLKCSYSIRFYMWLRSRAVTTNQRIDVDYLRDMLDLGDKYSLWKDLHKRVIKPVYEELTNTDMAFEYKQIKSGKKTIAIAIERTKKTQPIQISMFPDPLKEVTTTDKVTSTDQIEDTPDGPVNYTINAQRVLSKWNFSAAQIALMLNNTSHKEVCKVSYDLNCEKGSVMGNHTGWAYTEFIKRLGIRSAISA